MKWFFLTMSLCVGSLMLSAQETKKITLEFENLQNEGTLMVAIFDSQAGWEKYKPFRATMKAIDKSTTTLFFDVPKGLYGVAAFIDIHILLQIVLFILLYNHFHL